MLIFKHKPKRTFQEFDFDAQTLEAQFSPVASETVTEKSESHYNDEKVNDSENICS